MKTVRSTLDPIGKALNSARVFASWINLRLRAAQVTKRNSNERRRTNQEDPGSRSPHLLLLAWEFPPDISGGVYRPAALVKYAVRAGWRVTVAAGPLEQKTSAAGTELLRTIPPEVRLLRASPARRTSYKLLPNLDGEFRNIFPIERAAVAACQNHPPTVVMASGPAFVTFVSARFIARHFRAPLVLEYRDEWSVHTPPFVTVSAFDRKWERKLLQSASAVVFMTEPSRDVYLKSIETLDASKCFVVPNGWDTDDFAAEPNSVAAGPSANGGKFLVSFVGSIKDYTDPGRFLLRLQEVFLRSPSLRQRLIIRFTGHKSDESRRMFFDFQKRFDGSIELIEAVPKSAAVSEMQNADALLLLVDHYCFETAMPGKLYEYLAAGPPILAFGDSGPAPRIVRDLGAGIVVHCDNSAALELALLQLMEQSGAQWNTPERKAWIAGHTRGAQCAQVLRILSKIQTSDASRHNQGSIRKSRAIRHA